VTQGLYEKYYFSKPGYLGGTRLFHKLCGQHILPGSSILEIGAGPSNSTSKFLAGIGPLTGADVSEELFGNESLTHSVTFDGVRLPFDEQSFDAVSSNFVLEHVAKPGAHFKEVARILRPGGNYCFRTVNLFHYAMLASRLLPHSMHKLIANRVRKLGPEAHDPYPTVYRANTQAKLTKLCLSAGFEDLQVVMFEPEPAYGAVSPALFYPMMVYERIVSSTDLLKALRITILGIARKAMH
jgi:ubiquinone/menaquinone biosynthesis C-methylase UbiE